MDEHLGNLVCDFISYLIYEIRQEFEATGLDSH